MLDNDTAYSQACFPEPRTVCGITLKAYGIGHALTLRSIESPLIPSDNPKPVNFPDFFLALWVCSQSSTLGFNPAFAPLPIRWRIMSRIIGAYYVVAPDRLVAEAGKLISYVEESELFRPPIAIRNKDFCRVSSCPHFVPMQRTLAQFGFSDAEILNMPLRRAKWLHTAWLEHEGALRFATAHDEWVKQRMMQPDMIEWNKKIWEENRIKMAAKQAQN
jgi:hypothetical protein